MKIGIEKDEFLRYLLLQALAGAVYMEEEKRAGWFEREGNWWHQTIWLACLDIWWKHEVQEEYSLTPLEVIGKEIQEYDIGFNKYKQSYL